MSNLAAFLNIEHEFQPIPSAKTFEKLPPGVYTLKYDPRTEQISLAKSKQTHDELLNLPGTAYDQIMKDLDLFYSPECKDRFKKAGLLHKMNILLYGVPGGGKTCIVNRVSDFLVNQQGVVLFNPHPTALKETFRILDTLQPETPVLIIFEELDQLIDRHGEGEFLHILDGEIQKHNAMFIATTNFIDRIPARIKRPGRFAVRLEVGLPNHEARELYVRSKLEDENLSRKIADMTDGFTIDQLKDVIRAHYCMSKPLSQVISDLRIEFSIGVPVTYNEDAYEDFDEDEETISNQIIVGKKSDDNDDYILSPFKDKRR